MQNYTINNMGLTIFIQIDKDLGHNFKYAVARITHLYDIKSYWTDFKSFTIEVQYSETVMDAANRVLSSEALSYTQKNPVRYDEWYNLVTFNEANGDFLGKMAINGAMERSVGFRAFNDDGTLIDYSGVTPVEPGPEEETEEEPKQA